MTPQEQHLHISLAEWAVAKASQSLGNEEAEMMIQDEIANLYSFVHNVMILREWDNMDYLSWRDSLIEQRNRYGRHAEGRRIEKPNMENLTSTMTPAYFERVIAKLTEAKDIVHVIADDEHLIDFRRLEISNVPMSVTADLYPDGSMLMTQWWGRGDVESLSATKVTPSGVIGHDVSQIKAVLNKALDGCEAAYIQKKYPTFWKALDRITTDPDVPFIGGLHRRHPLQLQWVMSEYACISIDIGIDSFQISNSWNDDVVIQKWPAWLFSGRDRNKNTPPSYRDLMSLIMLPIHRMILEGESEHGNMFYRTLVYSQIVVDLCTGGEALMIDESIDYDTLLILLPSMDPTYEARKAAAKEQA